MRTVLLILPILLWAACGCPSDEKEGELTLSPEALAFIDYDNNTALTFRNEAGDTLLLSLTRGEELNNDPLCVRTTCTEASFGSDSSCGFYEAENRRYVFFSTDNTIVLDVLLYSGVYEYGTPEFFDALQVGLNVRTSSITGQHLIINRFADPDPNIQPLSNLFELREELVLNGKSFTNIWVYERGQLGIYVQPGSGVIGFKDAAAIWLVD